MDPQQERVGRHGPSQRALQKDFKNRMKISFLELSSSRKWVRKLWPVA